MSSNEEVKQFKIVRNIKGKYQCEDAYGNVYGEADGQRVLAFLAAVKFLKENITEKWELKY